jgi:transmembrane sensor
VERVLYRAWNERDRFATTESLLKHAQESALGAIAREEERRLAVTRFDADETAAGMPGDLQLLSMDAVLGRLRAGRRPTPSTPMPVVAAAQARPTAARPKLRSAQYITSPHRALAKPPRRVGLIAGGVAAIIAVAALARIASAPSAVDRARAAAADSTLPRISTTRGQRTDTTIAPGFRVVVGPASSVGVGDLASGIRAARVTGTAWLEIAEDSAAPMVVMTAGQRLETVGGALAIVSAADSSLVFAERGEVQHVAAERITRIPSGSTVVISATGEVTAADRDDATRAFAWRSGRLQTPRAPVAALRAPISQWFALELDTKGVTGDSAALDVPLDSVSALIGAISAATGRQVTRSGDRLILAEPSRPVRPATGGRTRPVRRDVVDTPAEEPQLPTLRKLPGVP